MTEHRPWGSYTTLEDQQTYKVKRIDVLPGKRLSYQKHEKRSEHWIVVQGEGIVTLEGREISLSPGKSIDIPRMAEIVLSMVKDVLDAFVNRNSRLARSVCERDDLVDGLNEQVFRELLTFMISDPKSITRSVHLLIVSRCLERIADHATNVAEDVIFMVDALVIKHHADEKEEEEQKEK